MAVDLKVPEMGESVTEVYIGQWQKKEGDRVEQDDPLVEIESEKATLDLRAPAQERAFVKLDTNDRARPLPGLAAHCRLD